MLEDVRVRHGCVASATCLARLVEAASLIAACAVRLGAALQMCSSSVGLRRLSLQSHGNSISTFPVQVLHRPTGGLRWPYLAICMWYTVAAQQVHCDTAPRPIKT